VDEWDDNKINRSNWRILRRSNIMAIKTNIFSKATIQGFIAIAVISSGVGLAVYMGDLAMLKEFGLIVLGFYLRAVTS
jgi:hypothetical protein